MTLFNKIVSLNKLNKVLKPHTATIISGTFDLSEDYYLKLLLWLSSKFHPIVVIVNTDRVVSIRRGFFRPRFSQRARAGMVARIDLVDYVLISSKGAHHEDILRKLRPKTIILQQDSKDFLSKLKSIIKKNFPHINVIVAPIRKQINFNSSKQTMIFNVGINNKILKKLFNLARKSNASIGKISAILVSNNRIIYEASNSAHGEHAERIILRKIKPEVLCDCDMYILIPPCIMCAEAIAKTKIKNVYFALNYGDKYGINYLKNAGIIIRRIKHGID